jgi:hypothetical protein
MSMSTNDNNNFGKHSMGGSEWAPSSRVLSAPGGASTISFGDYVPSPVTKPQRDMSRPRIIGGKVVLPQAEKDSAAAAYHAQFAQPEVIGQSFAAVEPAQPKYTSHSTSGDMFAHGSPAPAKKDNSAQLYDAQPAQMTARENENMRTVLSDQSTNKQPAASDPEMRGCEGYTPNYGAFANGGLQSSSTELKGPQCVGRSSTRLHAPPGGASSIVFG